MWEMWGMWGVTQASSWGSETGSRCMASSEVIAFICFCFSLRFDW